MANYWTKRIANEQQALADMAISAASAKMAKYYQKCAKKVLDDFDKVYNHIFLNINEGKEITPADLYKLDKYWVMQKQLDQELERLGNQQIKLLSNDFTKLYNDTYQLIELPNLSAPTFSTIDAAIAEKVISSVWCQDGKVWSERVWDNTKRLKQTLDENLIHCLITGKKTSDLNRVLQERFDVSFRRAETLIRTEMAHIQTESAKQRYQDYGIKYVEVLVSHDHKTCDKCKALIGKKWNINATPPLPVHPNERCCLVPVF